MCYNLVVVAPDGDRQIDSSHETVDQCWEASSDMGSKWCFYPFHVVTGPSRSTQARIVGIPELGGVGAAFKSCTVKTFGKFLEANPEFVEIVLS
jgi:hypothetical protein